MASAKKATAKSKKKIALKPAVKKTKKAIVKKVAVKRKTKKVLPIPKGYHSITPYLIIKKAAKAIEFYKKAFGAKEVMRMEMPGGKIAHAELKIGDSIIMLADECPHSDAKSPVTFGGSSVGIHLYVKDVDAVVKSAVAAGAKLTRPVQDMFYGDRSGTLKDKFGHQWTISTHIEDVTPAKIRKRAAELFCTKAKK